MLVVEEDVQSDEEEEDVVPSVPAKVDPKLQPVSSPSSPKVVVSSR